MFFFAQSNLSFTPFKTLNVLEIKKMYFFFLPHVFFSAKTYYAMLSKVLVLSDSGIQVAETF